jgi:hypothetical protein
MKKFIMAIVASAALLFTGTPVSAEVDTEVSVFSRHVFRGAGGPDAVSIQPSATLPVESNIGTTSVNIWGQIPITGDDVEYDFSVSQQVGDYGSIGVTSYFYGGPLLESDSHEIEVGVSGNYAGVDLFVGRFVSGDRVKDDTYLELGYELDGIGLAVGLGDGAYTTDGKFGLVNVGLSTANDDGYGAALIYNPDSEATFFVVSKSW